MFTGLPWHYEDFAWKSQYPNLSQKNSEGIDMQDLVISVDR